MTASRSEKAPSPSVAAATDGEPIARYTRVPSVPIRRVAPDVLVLIGLLVSALLLCWLAYSPPRLLSAPMDTLPVLLPRQNLHEPERLPGWSHTFRWTQERSTIEPANPGGILVARIILGGGTGRSPTVTLHAPGQSFTFPIAPEPRTYTLLLPPAGGERVPLRVESPTIREGGRTLGVMLSEVRLYGGRAAPVAVVLALLLATVCGYVLVRQAGGWSMSSRARLGGAVLILFAHVVVLLWQSMGGWRYALFVPSLLLASVAAAGAVLLERALPPHRDRERAPRIPQAAPLAARRLVLLVLLVLMALCMRLPWLALPDPVGDLELAARRMGFLFHDGLAGAYRYDGDYMPLRLYLLAGLSQLVSLLGGTFHAPLPTVTLVAIKLPGLVADLTTTAIIAVWSRRWVSERRALALALLYACSPPVWMNVAWWGQVDALLMLPLVAMVVLLDRAGGRWSWLCWTVALLIKPQAVVFAPLLSVATIRLHGSRGVLVGAAWSVGVFAAACTPLVLAGQAPGLAQAYLGSVGRFPKLTIGAYNMWFLLTGGRGGDDALLLWGVVRFRLVGLLLVGCVALLVMWVVLRRSDGEQRAEGAAVLGLAFFLLPTQIHERYLFLSLAFLALCIASDERVVWLFLALVATGMLNILGTLDGFVPVVQPLIAGSPIPMACAVVNLVVLVVLLWRLVAAGVRRV